MKVATPIKFLLVDDIEENLLALEATLRREGLEILMARSAREALELLLAHEIALALVDVQMPEMDGFELAELMRGTERTRHVPVIFVTAGGSEKIRVFKGYDAGAVDFLFKPIDPHILRHKTDTFFQLHRLRQELADTLRSNEELMAIVAHDLRNPLNVVLLTANVLAAKRENDPEVVKLATRIRTSGSRMVQIIDGLLDLSRARLGGGIPIERSKIDLAPLARRVVGEVEATNPARTIDLRVEGDLRGRWDADRIEQVLSNLIGNAAQHGAPERPIQIVLDGLGETVAITVHNDGVVPSEILPRLFEAFRSGTERSDGLGLGLYIVEQIIMAHGGTVGVESTEVDGTIFRVSLPRD